MKNKLCYYYFNNSCIGFISTCTCNYAKCNTDQVMNVSHNHTCMPVMFTTPWKRFKTQDHSTCEKQYTYVYIQTLNRATTPLARYGSKRFLHGTVRFLNGTVRFLNDTLRFLNATVRFLNGALFFLARYRSFHERYVSLLARNV